MIRIAICNHLILDRQQIKQFLQYYFIKQSYQYTITEFSMGEDLLEEYLDGKPFDIIFLDTFMNKITGIDIAYLIRKKDIKVKIIFFTVSEHFALKGYDVQAFGYLLKPLNIEKATIVMDRYIKEEVQEEQSLLAFIKGRYYRIFYEEIVYVESFNNFVIIHIVDGKERKIYSKIKEIEKRLTSRRFLRCHRSYIINMDYVSIVDKSFITTTSSVILIRQRELRRIKEYYYRYISSKSNYIEDLSYISDIGGI